MSHGIVAGLGAALTIITTVEVWRRLRLWFTPYTEDEKRAMKSWEEKDDVRP